MSEKWDEELEKQGCMVYCFDFMIRNNMMNIIFLQSQFYKT